MQMEISSTGSESAKHGIKANAPPIPTLFEFPDKLLPLLLCFGISLSLSSKSQGVEDEGSLEEKDPKV